MIFDKDKKDHDDMDQDHEEDSEKLTEDSLPIDDEPEVADAPKEYAFDDVRVSDADTLSNYIRNINKFPMLEPDEEYELARKWCEEGDNKAAQKIVQSHLRLVTKIASGYKGYGLPLHDLIAEGNIGVLQALRRFDSKKGFRFSTYAMWWIKASIKDYIMKSWSLVKIGTTSAQKKLFFGLKGAKKKLQISDDVGLGAEELKKISQDLGVSEEEVFDMDLRLSGSDYSLNSFVGDDNESEWQDWLVDDDTSHETHFVDSDEQIKRQKILDQAYECLDEREYVILKARRLTEPPKTLEDISQEYGISRERVRQIEVKAFSKLQKHVRDIVQEHHRF